MDISTYRLSASDPFRYLGYLTKCLNDAHIPFITLKELGYEPAYQGTLFLLITPTTQHDTLDLLSQKELNLGDDSYSITYTGESPSGHIYLIDICQ